jgi:hypothetical protein
MTETGIKQDDDNMEDGAVGIIWMSVSGVHSFYQSRAGEAGKVVLEIEDFWNKFRRRFPGSDWGWEKWGTDDEYNIGRAVYVRLRPTDSDLAAERYDDGFFTSEGHDAVLDAFIRDQGLFPAAPYPGDDGFGEWFRQNLLSGNNTLWNRERCGWDR